MDLCLTFQIKTIKKIATALEFSGHWEGLQYFQIILKTNLSLLPQILTSNFYL